MRNTYLIFILSLFLWTSCKTNTKDNSSLNATSTEVSTSNKTDNNTNINNLDVSITTSSGSLLGGFNLSPIKIVADNVNYTHKSKPNKHKFYANGQMKYEVKFKESGLKLRDKNSNLLWKVKIYPDKIKVSNNEENTNAFVIKSYENKIKVKRNEEELYKVKLKGTTVVVNEKEAYTLSSKQTNYAFAILAIEEIPNEHKLFLIAELLNKI